MPKAAITAILAVSVFALSIWVSGRAAAAVPYDSAYQFESAFLTNLQPGDIGTFSVFFANTGTTTWTVGTSTQVNLVTCLDDKTTCSVAPEEAAWNPGSWVSATAYATHTKAGVVPGDFSAFTYSVKVPSSAGAGTYRFNGDLAVAATGVRIHPEGYYQDATVVVAAVGSAAPNDVQAQVGNLNTGTTNNDVRILFTAPSTNTIQTYDVQRAIGLCPVPNNSTGFVTVATVTVTPGAAGSYNDLDRPVGSYCYQVRVTNPTTGAFSYSNQVVATVFGSADTTRPRSDTAVLTSSANFVDTLDQGDSFIITFSEAMTVSTNALIRVTDADCGAPVSQGSGPPACPSNRTQTVADITCGSNATCVLTFDGLQLRVTMTASPSDVASGTVPGVQFPAVITDTQGITDLAGNTWDLTNSADRVIGPLGQ